MNKKLKIFILLAGLFILTACVVKNQSKAHYHIEEGQKIKDTYYYDVEENFDGMSLEIDLELEKGEVEFQLIDPNGKVRWEEKVNSSEDFEEKREFEKVVGKWELLFESIDESGEGSLDLEFNKK